VTDKIHILGNGDTATLMPQSTRNGQDGKVIVCNQPPFNVKAYACALVDFKMMKALQEGSVNLDMFNWVCGNRPKMHMAKHSSFYIKHAHRIREFYTDVPKYCGKNPAEAATNFNCGHLATHYACKRHQPDEIHMYGFDSIFDHNMRSHTDLVLPSDRGKNNNYRLLDVWRPIWVNIFKEFQDIQFVLWHKHPNAKVDLPTNIRFETP
jgi:hypothetical protein